MSTYINQNNYRKWVYTWIVLKRWQWDVFEFIFLVSRIGIFFWSDDTCRSFQSSCAHRNVISLILILIVQLVVGLQIIVQLTITISWLWLSWLWLSDGYYYGWYYWYYVMLGVGLANGNLYLHAGYDHGFMKSLFCYYYIISLLE